MSFFSLPFDFFRHPIDPALRHLNSRLFQSFSRATNHRMSPFLRSLSSSSKFHSSINKLKRWCCILVISLYYSDCLSPHFAIRIYELALLISLSYIHLPNAPVKHLKDHSVAFSGWIKQITSLPESVKGRIRENHNSWLPAFPPLATAWNRRLVKRSTRSPWAYRCKKHNEYVCSCVEEKERGVEKLSADVSF